MQLKNDPMLLDLHVLCSGSGLDPAQYLPLCGGVRRIRQISWSSMYVAQKWARDKPRRWFHWSRTLRVFTLGGFGIVAAGRSIDIGKWKRQQAVALLKNLFEQQNSRATPCKEIVFSTTCGPRFK